ncbi:hypothetical protein DsansV1_C09g0087931 [Dioscorea sansibarensis]
MLRQKALAAKEIGNNQLEFQGQNIKIVLLSCKFNFFSLSPIQCNAGLFSFHIFSFGKF